MSASGSNNFLNIEDANLRVRSGNVHALGMTVGGITVGASFGLQSVTNSGNITSNTLQFTNATTAFVTTANVEIGGSLTVGGTKTFVVTVQQVSGVNKYFINGVDRPILQLHQYQTYIFDLSDSSLVSSPGHPFIFSETADGDAYDTGITTTGTPGNAGAKKTFVVPAGAPTTLYYYCTQHPSMGATVNIGTVTDLVVTGTRGTTLGGGTTAQRSVYPLLGTMRYNSQTGYMEAYTVSGWGSIATPPTIQTISPTSVAVADVTTQVFTVTGAFFDALTTLQLQGGDLTLYDVTDFVFTNSGSLRFKIGTLASGQAANRPFKVVVTNGAGLSGTSIATITFSGLSWTSPAAGATLTFSTTVSTNNTELAATDDLGGTNRAFSVPASNLPSGLTLNGSTGEITGTIGAVGTTSVTFRVTDTVSGATLDRTFSIVGFTGLFPFTSFKFTNAGKTGRDGPSLNEIRAHADYDTNANSHGYPPPSWDMTDSSLFNLGVENNGGVSRNGFQLWTVPADGNYTIQAQGAMGGDAPVSPAASPGKGARVQADFALTQGTKINILVGQGGMATTITTGYPHPSPGASNGGGGATWVLKQNFTTSTNDIYLIAGGGTGTSEYGNYSTTAAHGNGDTQGTSSAGGAQSPNGSSGGAGWGADGNPTSHNTRGRRPHVGAQGGLLNQPTLGEGGFGGGGAGQDHSPGGGGGYGGAGGAYYSNMGGYGSASSWIMTTVNNRSFLGNPYNGAAGEAGWVIITKL